MRLCMWAASAWKKAGCPHYADQDSDMPECIRLSRAQALELWRHEQQHKACGKRHLTACTQRDYLALRAHWKLLLGQPRKAIRDAIESAVGERQVALHKLRKECSAALDVVENPYDYVSAIAWRRYKSRPEHLSSKQIWSLIITLRSRACKRRRSEAEPPNTPVDTRSAGVSCPTGGSANGEIRS